MKSKRILLAEDDGDDQKFFIEFLNNRKDIVLLPAVENGEELLEYLKKSVNDGGLPDAIILDQNMPKLNGLQTLSILKKSKRYAHIPVMVYSTYADENLTQKSMASGAALVMAKPLTKEGYQDLIDELIKVVP